MNGNSHILYSASVGSMIALNLDTISKTLPNIESNQYTATLFIMGGLIGGIFPDIDNPNSYMGKLTLPVSKIIGKASRFLGKGGSHHRGIFHDSTIYLIGLVLCYFYFPPLCGMMLGCLSHVILDMFNPMGTPFLFGLKHIRLGTINAGSRQGRVITLLLCSANLIIGIYCYFYFR